MRTPTFIFPWLAPVLGYLATWFAWGVPLPALVALWVGGAALWTLAPRSGEGGWTLARSFLVAALIGLVLWLVGAGVLTVSMVLSPDNPLPIGFWLLLPILVLGGVVVAGALGLMSQVAREAQRGIGWPALTPWLWLAGALAFVLLPAVRADCRGLNSDSFLSSSSGFSGTAGMNYWGNHPERITGRGQLPTDLGGIEVHGGATFCTQDAAGRSRVFSFRASDPQILVQLSEYDGAQRTFYALFSLGEHQQLTPWTAGEWVPFYSANITNYLAWPGVRVVEDWPEGIPRR